jgi:hypothetical protein
MMSGSSLTCISHSRTFGIHLREFRGDNCWWTMDLVIVRIYPINYEHEITLVIPEAEFESHLVHS